MWAGGISAGASEPQAVGSQVTSNMLLYSSKALRLSMWLLWAVTRLASRCRLLLTVLALLGNSCAIPLYYSLSPFFNPWLVRLKANKLNKLRNLCWSLHEYCIRWIRNESGNSMHTYIHSPDWAKSPIACAWSNALVGVAKFEINLRCILHTRITK